MKRINFIIIAFLLVLCLPILVNADTSVRVTLSSNDIWVAEGEQASLKIDVLNTGTDPITISGYTLNGVTETTDITINGGSVHRFNLKTDIDFGTDIQKSVISSVTINELGTVSSNATVLYKKTSVPATLIIDPLSTVVNGGETVEYTIAFTNNSAYDYTDISIAMDKTTIVPAFSCAPGETQTFTYSRPYTKASEHIFSYTFSYLETDGSTKTSGGSERATVSVYASQPTGELLEGAELLPSVLTAMADEDTGYDLRLYLKNNSTTVLTSVHVYDQNGTDYGGWSKIGLGQTAGMTISLTPVEETTYVFTAYGEDANGDMRMMTADAVLIAVGSVPDGFGEVDTSGTVVNTTQDTEPITIAKASNSKKVYVVLGIIVGGIVLSLLVIVLLASGRKNIVRTKTRKKSSKGKGGRNIF
ncbi:MAG: hypothetical protein AB1Z19_06410 [Eubacteriales bacterium]